MVKCELTIVSGDVIRIESKCIIINEANNMVVNCGKITLWHSECERDKNEERREKTVYACRRIAV